MMKKPLLNSNNSLSRLIVCALGIVLLFTLSAHATLNTFNIKYYGTSECRSCMTAKSSMSTILEVMRETHPDVSVNISEVDVRTPSGAAQLKEVGITYGIAPSIPVFIINGSYLINGLGEYNRFVESGNFELFFTGAEPQPLLGKQAPRLTFLVLAIAGLVDGINPCALAMLLFLLSYLSTIGMEGTNHRRILIVGWIYAAATFLTYFIIGAGLMHFLMYLTFLPYALRIIYAVTIVFCLLLAFVNINDYRMLKKGEMAAVKTQLPKYLKSTIYRLIQRKTNPKYLYISTFLISVIVSLIDFLCTGQIYLPTLTYLLSTDPTRISLYGYLAIYNASFILPIIVVFHAVYFGKTTITTSLAITKKLPAIKILATVFYLSVASYIGVMLWQLITH